MLKFQGSIREIISSLGLAIVLSAIPLGMYAKIFLGIMDLNSYLFVVGVLLLIPFNNITNNNISIPSHIKWCMGFTLLAIFYEVISSYDNNMHYLYNLLVIAACIVVGKSRYEVDFAIYDVVKWTWLFSAVNVILTVFVISRGLYGIYAEYEPGTDILIYDDLTAGSCCITNVACSLYLLSKYREKAYMRYLCLLFIFIDFYGVILSAKRTPLIVMGLIVLYFIYKQHVIKNIFRWHNFIIAVVGIFILMFFISFNSESVDVFTNTFRSIGTGIHDMVYGTNTLDVTNSGSIRYYNRMEALNTINAFNVFELLFGAGYMTQWIDVPVLQAYMDMGIIGFILFCYLTVIKPIKIIFLQKKLSPELLWGIMMCSYGVISCLNSGHPYGHGRWLPVVLFYYIFEGEKQIEKLTNTY